MPTLTGADGGALLALCALGAVLAATVVRPQHPAPEPPPPYVSAIDPNTADAVALTRVPGIGPALAARIVASREADGPFRNLADLARVRGIGPALLAALEPWLAWGDPPPETDGPAP